MNNYYIYFHINPLKNEIFYVGKGKGKRAFEKGSRRGDYWNRIVEKYGYIIDIAEDNLTEQEAFDREIFYINKIGRKDLGLGSLINMTCGGEGSSGYKHSTISINKMSAIKVGRKLSYETKKKMSESRINPSKEIREKISKAGKGRKRTDETKKRISEAKKGDKNPAYNKGNSYLFNNVLYTSLTHIWREFFSDIHINTLAYRIKNNKIEGLIRLNKNNNTL